MNIRVWWFLLTALLLPLQSIGAGSNPPSEQNQHFIVCLTKVMGTEWDINITAFLRQWLGQVYPIKIFNSPVKRSVFSFDNGACNAYFASPATFSDILNRQDIFNIKTPVLKAELRVYSRNDANFIPSIIDLTPEELIKKMNHPRYSVGYYDTEMINGFMTKFSRTNQLPLPSIEKAFELLRRSKIDFVLVPEVNTGFPDEFEEQKSSLSRIQSLVSVPLHLWLSSEFAEQEVQIEQRLITLLNSGQWTKLNQVN